MDMNPGANPQLPAARACRQDGWTAQRQRTFLEAIAEGYTVEEACRLVALSPASAYALRRRAAGASFALGWAAANLLARDKLADTLLARAIDGQVDTVTRADGSTFSRHRYDNKLGAAMLARLDRAADGGGGGAGADPSIHRAARLIAAEFDGYLDLIERDGGPARAGLFVGTRLAGDDVAPDLGPLMALARADRWLRAGAGLGCEVDISDLDPAARSGWTIDQWRRAEAAGMIAFAEVEKKPPASQLSQLNDDPAADSAPAEAEEDPVWWDEDMEEWRTWFPPPADFDGDCTTGDYTDPDYERSLTPAEEALVNMPYYAEMATRLAAEREQRNRWFADTAAQIAAAGIASAEELEDVVAAINAAIFSGVAADSP